MSSNSKNVIVNLELGHRATVKTRKTNEGFTHDWEVFVQGSTGAQIESFIEKIVFYLHSSFAKPKRVLRNSPFKVCEKGYGGFILPIEIYFKSSEEPRKTKFDYDLYLQSLDSAPISYVRKEKLTFIQPNEDFRRKLLQGGGTEVSNADDSRMNEKSSKSRPSSGAKTKPVVRHHAPSSVAPSNHHSASELSKKSKIETKKEPPKPKESDQFTALFGEIIKKESSQKKGKEKKEEKEEKKVKKEKVVKEKESKPVTTPVEKEKKKEREKDSKERGKSRDKEKERKKEKEKLPEKEKKVKEEKKDHGKRPPAVSPSPGAEAQQSSSSKKRKEERDGKRDGEGKSSKDSSERERSKGKEKERKEKKKEKEKESSSKERELKPVVKSSPIASPSLTPLAPPIPKEEKKKTPPILPPQVITPPQVVEPPKPPTQATRGRPRKDAKRPPLPVVAAPVPTPIPPVASSAAKGKPKTPVHPPAPPPPPVPIPVAAPLKDRSKSSSRSRSPSLSISSSSASSRSSSVGGGSPPTHSPNSHFSRSLSRSRSRSSSRSRSRSSLSSSKSHSKSPSFKSGSRSHSRSRSKSKSGSSSSSCGSSPSRGSPASRGGGDRGGKGGAIHPLEILAREMSESSSDSEGKSIPVAPPKAQQKSGGRSTPSSYFAPTSSPRLPTSPQKGAGKSKALPSPISSDSGSEGENSQKSRGKSKRIKRWGSNAQTQGKESTVGDANGALSTTPSRGVKGETSLYSLPINGTSSGNGALASSPRKEFNTDYLSELLDLRTKIMESFSDRTKVQEIVNIIGCGTAYQLTQAHFTFDLCSLDRQTIRKLQSCLS